MEFQATAIAAEFAAARKESDATREGPQLPSVVKEGLSAKDLDCLRRLLTEPVTFVDNPDLHEPDAEARLFGVDMSLDSADATRLPDPEPIVIRSTTAGSRLATLSLKDEQRLFLRINYVRMRIGRILAEFSDKELTLEAARTLVAWGWMELDVRSRIVEQNVPLVLAMAKRTRLAGIDYNEMISEGNMALLRSVDKFDCGRGFKFSTYACRAILKSFSRVAIRWSRYKGAFPVEFDPSIEKSDHLEK
jgi:hypothetical protein